MTQPKTRQQIAAEYQIHPKTLTRKLQRFGLDLPKGVIMPADLNRIYRVFGYPADVLPEPLSP